MRTRQYRQAEPLLEHDVQQVMQETNMDYIQALHHVQSRQIIKKLNQKQLNERAHECVTRHAESLK